MGGNSDEGLGRVLLEELGDGLLGHRDARQAAHGAGRPAVHRQQLAVLLWVKESSFELHVVDVAITININILHQGVNEVNLVFVVFKLCHPQPYHPRVQLGASHHASFAHIPELEHVEDVVAALPGEGLHAQHGGAVLQDAQLVVRLDNSPHCCLFHWNLRPAAAGPDLVEEAPAVVRRVHLQAPEENGALALGELQLRVHELQHLAGDAGLVLAGGDVPVRAVQDAPAGGGGAHPQGALSAGAAGKERAALRGMKGGAEVLCLGQAQRHVVPPRLQPHVALVADGRAHLREAHAAAAVRVRRGEELLQVVLQLPGVHVQRAEHLQHLLLGQLPV
mmetsp:Transcript_36403/g.63094  ORF Transcript_36403/g.63094 Transcript_36403/m.63094 type:complete len:335 (+) Transcript_36403:1094-2098(+)